VHGPEALPQGFGREPRPPPRPPGQVDHGDRFAGAEAFQARPVLIILELEELHQPGLFVGRGQQP
jgi:hypothetical protein